MTFERYATTSFSQNPKQLERLDTSQAARALEIPMVEFVDMWKKGHITDKYVRRDPETKKWYVNKCDLPDLKAEIAAHKAGDVKVVKEGPKLYTMGEMATATGMSVGTVFYKMKHQLHAKPVSMRRSRVGKREHLYDASCLEWLRKNPPDRSVRTYKKPQKPPQHRPVPAGRITLSAMAKTLGLKPEILHNMRYRKDWPEGLEPVGQQGTAYLFEEAAVTTLKDYMERKTQACFVNSEAPVFGKRETPVKSSVNYFDVALELRSAGFEEAAVWMIKNKC